MATLSLFNATSNSCSFTISGLGADFNTSNYMEVGVASGQCINDSTTPPSGIVATVYAPSSGTTRDITDIITGLSPNTNYIFYGYAKAANGKYYQAGGSAISTLQAIPTVPSSPPDALYPSYRYEGVLDLTWGSSQYATSYTLKYKISSGSYQYISGLGTSHYLSGLNYGTPYYFSCRGDNSVGSSDFTWENIINTRPQTPSISIGTITSTSIQINIGSMSGNYDNIGVVCYDGEWNIVETQYGYSYGSLTFSGLTNGETYHFQAWSYLTVGGTTLQSYSYGQCQTTLNARPQNWSWSYNIQSGGNVYSTVFSNGQIIAYIMLSSEWVNFCNRINSFREYLGLSVYNFTNVLSDNDCTPSIINECVNAINEMGFNILTASSGSIYASTFIAMRDSLNSIL